MTEISTFHMAFAFIFTMAVVISHCVERYQRNRADNLQQRNLELACRLDDALREVARYKLTNSYLLRENSVLLLELTHTKRHNQHLERQILAASAVMAEPIHYQTSDVALWN